MLYIHKLLQQQAIGINIANAILAKKIFEKNDDPGHASKDAS